MAIIEKLKRYQEKEVQVLAAVAFITIAVGSVLFIVFFKPDNSLNSAEQQAQQSEQATEDIIAYQKIIDKTSVVPVYLIQQNQETIRLSPDTLTITDNSQQKIVPFFFTKSEAEAFMTTLKQHTQVEPTTLKVDRVSLSTIYGEQIKQSENRYLLFHKTKEQWIYYDFNKIPVHVIVHRQKGHAFFVNIKLKNSSLITIPYFLNIQDAQKRLQNSNLQAEWKIESQYLEQVLEKIVKSELGQNVVLVPYEIDIIKGSP